MYFDTHVTIKFVKGIEQSFNNFFVRVSPLGSPSVINMLAPLVRCMFAIAYGENESMLLQMKGLVWGTGQALLRSPRGRNASRDGLVKLGWVHCLQYTVNCFQYNVCGLCRCEPSNH